MLYTIVSFIHISVVLDYEMQKLLLCISFGFFSLLFIDLKHISIHLRRISNIHDRTLVSPWVVGLLIFLVMIIITILSYCAINKFTVHFHLLI